MHRNLESLRFIIVIIINYFKLTKPQKFFTNNYRIVAILTSGMLIKVNSLIYKTKVNVKIKLKLKIIYSLIM